LINFLEYLKNLWNRQDAKHAKKNKCERKRCSEYEDVRGMLGADE